MEHAVEKGVCPRTGAQFFINPDDTMEDVQKHFRLMKEYGIRLVRLFILWDHVEPRPGQWEFERYDAVYELAARQGIQIVSTLTAEDPPGWLEEKIFYHHYADLNRNDLKEAAARYIEKVVSRYWRHPAHYAWILMNEPELLVNQNKETMDQFRTWLAKKYGTIEALNQKRYYSFSDFQEVTVNLPETPEYWQCFPSFTDWHAFLKDNLCGQLAWIQGEIRKIDSVSPTHVNPKGFFGNLAGVGQDYFKEAKVVDILGASIHPAWKFLWFSRPEYGLAYSFCVDLIRSAARGRSFWVTELQAGPTVMTGVCPCTPSPQEITAWLWDAVGAGAKAVIYWMWHPRTFGQEAGEWGLVTANHKVSRRMTASAGVSRLLRENRELFAKAEPEPAQTAVFYNHGTEVLSLIEGSPLYRTQEAPIQALCGVYKALMSAHIPVDFIAEDDIRQGRLENYKAVYFPYSYALDADLQEKLLSYIKGGGSVWADAPFAQKNSEGEILRNSEALYKAFGMDVIEFQGCEAGEDGAKPYLCQADLESVSARIQSRFGDGSPAVLRHTYGKGHTCFVNSAASLGYFQTRLEVFRKQIVSFAEERTDREMEFPSEEACITSRVLRAGEERIIILENWSEREARCVLRGRKKGIGAVRKITEETRLAQEENQVLVTLGPKESAVFVAGLREGLQRNT